MNEDEARALQPGDILEWTPSGELAIVREVAATGFRVAYTDGTAWVGYDEAAGFMSVKGRYGNGNE